MIIILWLINYWFRLEDLRFLKPIPNLLGTLQLLQEFNHSLSRESFRFLMFKKILLNQPDLKLKESLELQVVHPQLSWGLLPENWLLRIKRILKFHHVFQIGKMLMDTQYLFIWGSRLMEEIYRILQ